MDERGGEIRESQEPPSARATRPPSRGLLQDEIDELGMQPPADDES